MPDDENEKKTSIDKYGHIKLDLSHINMEELVTEALLTKLTDEDKNILIKGALKYLTTPKQYGGTVYGGKGKETSPLQEAFNKAVNDLAYKLAEEFLTEGTEARKELQEVITKGYEIWLKEDKIELCQRIANQITKGLSRDNY